MGGSITKANIIKEAVERKARAKSIIRTSKLKLSQIGRIRSASDFSIGHRSGYNDPTASEVIYRDSLRETIKMAEKDYEEAQRIIRNQLRSIKDPTVRAIYRCRLVKQMSWGDVAETVNMEEAAAKMRFYREQKKTEKRNKRPA